MKHLQWVSVPKRVSGWPQTEHLRNRQNRTLIGVFLVERAFEVRISANAGRLLAAKVIT